MSEEIEEDMKSDEYDSDDSAYVAWKKRKEEEKLKQAEKEISRVEKPTFTEEELNTLVQYVKNITTLYDLRESDWNDECIEVIKTFLLEPEEPVLSIYFDEEKLTALLGYPTIPIHDLTYFFRDTNAILTPQNFHDEVTFGTVNEDIVRTMLLIVENLYAPMFYEITKWPETIKSEFCSRVNTFLQNITDFYYKMLGLTVLYIPKEGLTMHEDDAAQDKNLVKRLEAVVVQWIRQIRTAIGDKNQVSPNELLCPSDEYDFWVYRHECLSALDHQIKNKSIQHIKNILQATRSLYIATLNDLCGEIEKSIAEAKSNIEFLSIINEPCTKLKNVQTPEEIAPFIPQILNLFRIIWINSPHYNTPNRISALCRALSNEIIIYCTEYIDLQLVFEGKTRAAIKMFASCISACKNYEETYYKIVNAHKKFGDPNFPWELNTEAIFSNVHAFVLRCQDMIEICQAMIAFGRFDESQTIPKPTFGGDRSDEFEAMITKVENIIKECIEDIKKVASSILNVQDTTWFNEILKFRIKIKSCETIIENLMIAVFDSRKSFAQVLEALGYFYNYSQRPNLQSIYKQKTQFLYKLFSDRIQKTKEYLINNKNDYLAILPYYAGRALMAYLKKVYIENYKQLLEEAVWLPPVASVDEVFEKCNNLLTTIDDLMKNYYRKWVDNIPDDQLSSLKRPLLCKSLTRPGYLEVDFDRNVLELYKEAEWWQRIYFDISILDPLLKKKEQVMYTYDSMIEVVLGYNKIISSLSDEERVLFKQLIIQLDKKIAPGLNNLNWTHNVADDYLVEVSTATAQLQEFLDDYKQCNLEIMNICEKICNMPLIQVTRHHAFELKDLIKHMDDYREEVLKELAQLYRKIIEFFIIIFEGFESHITNMGTIWINFVVRYDELLETSIKISVRNSLRIMYEILHGDGNSAPSPVLKLTADLKQNQIHFEPSVTEVDSMVSNILQNIVEAISIIPRISETFRLPGVSLKPYHDIIANDEECKSLQSDLCYEVTFNVGEIQEYKKVWDPFVEIWQVDKDRFIERYERQNPNASAFDTNIGRYIEVANNVSIQETVTPVHFLVVNAAKLKKSIMNHCWEWQYRLFELLKKMTYAKIAHVYEYIATNSQKIMHEPKNLDELQHSIKLLAQIESELAKEEAQFPLIEDQIRVLDKYQIEIDDAVRANQMKIPSAWKDYLNLIEEARAMINKSKDEFRKNLLNLSKILEQDCENLLADFLEKAPTTYDYVTADALAILNNFHQQYLTLKERENRLRKDLGIFRISQPDNISLQKFNTDFQALKLVWDLTNEWDHNWEIYKYGEFWKINIDDMEDKVTVLFRKLNRLSRELKEKNWTIVEYSRGRVDAVRRVLPLITALKNPAMRERHWDRVRKVTGTDFDQTSKSFTLELILGMEMQNYSDEITEISEAATGELQIEEGIKALVATWNALKLSWEPGIEQGLYKLVSVDDAMKALEENALTISVMKGTKYVQPFQKTVDHWESTLSYISESLENVLTVQRQYLYMASIFAGEDIRKQLPKETKNFDKLTHDWKVITSSMYSQATCLKACTFKPPPYLLNKLIEMIDRMELIQRALEKYLETKRHIFPRFYFISNDDLLEILGNSKKPELVQRHLKKLFDNLVKLKLQKYNLKNEAYGMYASDGEYIDFIKKLPIDGNVEHWLNNVQDSMRACLREQMRLTKNALRRMLKERDKWLMQWPGQCILTTSIMQWTADCTRALTHCKLLESKKPLKKLRRKQNTLLAQLTEITRKELKKLDRLKTNALITVEIHSRDVIDRMYKAGCMDVNDFEWFSQLRFYWERDIDDVGVRQTNTFFVYFYEYLGNSGRLVITPLTDRCYITLTTALHLYRGGSPKGPAGTGKTETVKDLGKALGMWVIVMNCSEGLDYKSMGKFFSGLVQSGTWGCFDEFNRINIEVLSVIAQQVLSILSALSNHQKQMFFEGANINVVPTCGLFITMNPGYAGRTELPDNLKSMFRPISMMVPDSGIIAENLLFSDGFEGARILAKKVVTLYQLSTQQLSKQDHYDFGLRSMVALLRYAGVKRREHPDLHEEQMVYLAMSDMNIAKLTSDDLPLFNAIISDIFPGVSIPHIDYDDMVNAIKTVFGDLNAQPIQNAITKIIQLYETKGSRHSVMILGATCTAKSVTWKGLKETLTLLAKHGKSGFVSAMEYPINPKALSLGELYGEYNLSTGEWLDGVLSAVMRTVCADESPSQKWILFDGPVDAVWIENMNSVMDDNKILTLINGERITMPEQVSLLFEVGDLSVASPATVSRCGMVYNDYKDWGWRPYVKSWLSLNPDTLFQNQMNSYFETYIDPILELKKLKTFEVVPVPELNLIISLCRLLNCFVTRENGCDPSDLDAFRQMTKMWFLFCMIWSVCITVDTAGRKVFDAFIREMDGIFPLKDTVYEYYIDVRGRTFQLWETLLNENWSYNNSLPFYKITVPTIDTVRYDYIMSMLLKKEYPSLIIGPVGTGKTSIMMSIVEKMNPEEYSYLAINMSAQTSSNNIQETIESKLEKRTKLIYAPVSGKRLTTLLDDLNMPAKDTYGSQPPLELLRLWIDYGFWYDREKQWRRYVKNMQLMAAMGPPGGGRQVISDRFLSKFNVIFMTFPSEASITRIFGTMLQQHVKEFDHEIKALAPSITEATLGIYMNVSKNMLPTPAKMHYLFNMRDISKVFQGLLRAHKDYQSTKPAILRLWIHEVFRVLCDRLTDSKDFDLFLTLLNTELNQHFELAFHNLCPTNKPPIFVDFVNPYNIYEDIQDMAALRKYLENQLVEYNVAPGTVRMDIVLFKDAIEHICRITRVISQPRGNMLLIGIGGSGRQSLARLSAYICECQTFQIEVTKQYKVPEFREDMKKLYKMTGVQEKATSFLFNDTQVADESFMEIINNILSSGEVANLFKKDEFQDIKNSLEKACTKNNIPFTTEAVYAFFIQRARENLHVILCLSPIGEAFRNRLRQYPSLVNCTTIDWFHQWPVDALLEVANKSLIDVDFVVTITGEPKVIEKNQENNQEIVEDEEEETEDTFKILGQDELREAVASVFALVHSSVDETSQRMLRELRRYNYVTPTNYLELVEGYKKMLQEKRIEKKNYSSILRNGVNKIEDTRLKVSEMTIELETAQVQIKEFQVKCDEVLAIIQQKKKEADAETIEVAAKSAKIEVEEKACLKLKESAEADLNKVMPALEAAMEALNSLNKKDITEVRSYPKPPQKVEMVMEAVMILKGLEPTWAEAKRQLGDQYFLDNLRNFDKNNVSEKTLKKIERYTLQDDFQPDKVGIVSLAAKSLSMWVIAIEKYAKVWKIVAPKKAKLEEAEASLKEKQDLLAAAKAKLKQLSDMIEELQQSFNEKMHQKEELNKKAEDLKIKLERAAMLLEGLSDEKIRWAGTVKTLEIEFDKLPGDVLMSTASISYTGPFVSDYREYLLKLWKTQIRKAYIPSSEHFEMIGFLADPAVVRKWNEQGLPYDNFSIENGIIITRCTRWPLIIDPQCQAVKWIRRMEAKQKLKVVDFGMSDYSQIMEAAIKDGTSILLQNVGETLEPTLTPILNRAIITVNDKLMIKFNEKMMYYNTNFRFFITTKLPNPHYGPEISTKTTLVNFAIKEQGLEAQLLGIIVRKEKPSLEEQKSHLVTTISKGKKTLKDLETELLRILYESKGSLLENLTLISTLEISKKTSAEVIESLKISEATEIEIDQAREEYRICAKRASILFFVLNDMSKIDPMYQFSLDSYLHLFEFSILRSPRSVNLATRLDNLNEFHTYSLYKNTCRALFEKHKLLFSFHMCMKILMGDQKINLNEYMFLLKGGVVLNRETQPDNPCSDWLTDECWDNITELDKVSGFHGVITSFEQSSRDWRDWYITTEPENMPLIGEWNDNCNDFQRMLFIRSLRQDRFQFCASRYIINTLGQRFVEPPVLDIKTVLDESIPQSPLIFVLSPGVDPTNQLLNLADSMDMTDKFLSLSLGQGQAPIATRMILQGTKEGHWVYLANCHLSLSWMPVLDKMVENLSVEKVHQRFRLWLSSSPTPQFPLSILQAGIKMTTEPPKGLKANLKRLYNIITEEQFAACQTPQKFKKLLFSLCFFHSILIERKKFQQLGWNVIYSFNDSDFEISQTILSMYLDEYPETPWDALKYLIAGVNYGGHVTDDWDRRLLLTYINQYFNEMVLNTPLYRLSSLSTYYVPKDGSLESYQDYITILPVVDRPEVFGQHPNADITCLITETKDMLGTLLSLQGQIEVGEGNGESKDEKVMKLANEILEKLPKPIDYDLTFKNLGPNKGPLDVVLLQEILRYNVLLKKIRKSLQELEKAIKGFVVMSSELEDIFDCMYEGRVPPVWLKAYCSLKRLGSWTRDLILRVEHFATWANTVKAPLLFWLAAYTFPTGFLTAVLQVAARKDEIPIDTLSWEFTVFTHLNEAVIVEKPDTGVYIRGTFLEGAGWNLKKACLEEPEPMKLIYNMPLIHFKPTEVAKKKMKGIYSCPCYYYPIREGIQGKPAFVIAVDLKSGDESSDHWIKRGTALLLSLSN